MIWLRTCDSSGRCRWAARMGTAFRRRLGPNTNVNEFEYKRDSSYFFSLAVRSEYEFEWIYFIVITCTLYLQMSILL